MKRILFAALLILGAQQTCEAQLFKKLRNKVKAYQKTAEQKLEGKIDRQVEKQMDYSLEKAFDPTLSTQQSEPINKTFKFTQLVSYEMRIGDEIANEFTMYTSSEFKDQMIRISAQGQNMKMIIDADKNIYSFLEYDGQKIQMGFPSKQFNTMFRTEELNEDAELIITGNEKEILGYYCKEYMVKSDNEELHLWITDEINLNSPFLSEMNKNGVLLEMATTTKEGEFVMQATKIEENIDYTFESGQYKSISQMGN